MGKSLSEPALGFGELALRKAQISHLQVTGRRLWRYLNSFTTVLLGAGKLLALDQRHSPQGVTVVRSWLQINDLSSFLLQPRHILFLHGKRGQGAVRFDHGWVNLCGLTPFRAGAIQVSRLVQREPQLVVGERQLWVIAHHGLQSLDSIVGFALTQLDFTTERQALSILGMGFKKLIVEFLSFIQAVFQK